MIELPPLQWIGAMQIDDGSYRSLASAESVEARERILQARIAELEADAERYQWLASKAHKDTAYDRYGNGAYWRIGFFADDGRHALDAAIDAARKKS